MHVSCIRDCTSCMLTRKVTRAVAHGPAGQAMAGPVFGESFLIFSTEACKCCITYSSKGSTVNRPLEHM